MESKVVQGVVEAMMPLHQPINNITPKLKALVNYLSLLGWEHIMTVETPCATTLIFKSNLARNTTISSTQAINMQLPANLIAEVSDIMFKDKTLTLYITVEEVQ